MRSLSRVGGDRSTDGRRLRDCRRLHYGRIVPGNRGSVADQTLQADIYVSAPNDGKPGFGQMPMSMPSRLGTVSGRWLPTTMQCSD